MKNVALIVAAGSGERTGINIPKQYYKIADKSILEHTIEVFSNHPKIDAIKLVLNQDHAELYKDILSVSNKILEISIGGKNRQESVFNGLQSLTELNPENVLIHDAARPFLNHDTIDKIIDKLQASEAVETVIPCPDTAKLDNKIIDRNQLFLAQTPQSFKFKTILNLHEKAKGTFTDDISIAEQNGVKIARVIGSPQNFKITTYNDIIMASKLIESDYQIRTGFGYDVHQIEPCENASMMIAGVSIPSNFKIIAHSDGDVAIHAIVDSLLGALSLGDIGHHFPPSEIKWKDCPSSVFLNHTKNLLIEHHAIINNIDCMLIAETPKVKDYIEKMKITLAQILDIKQNQISIKATTSEKLGFIGRKEGIAANAVSTIKVRQGTW